MHVRRLCPLSLLLGERVFTASSDLFRWYRAMGLDQDILEILCKAAKAVKMHQ